MKEKLYNLPEYYDVAFSWDIASEINLLHTCFNNHVIFPVKTILEPGCGTGRFLVSLPKYGYNVTGYDNNPKMVEYAKKRIFEEGVDNAASVVLKDMLTARFTTKFDAAFNSINSLVYLLSDDDIIAHLRNTGKSLRRGGIYIVHISCAWKNLDTSNYHEWTCERDGIKIKTRWKIEKEDSEKRLSYQICTMDIDDNGKQIKLKDHHTMRLWIFEDLKALIHTSGKFTLEAIYTEKQEKISLTTHISGELGNLYFVLKTS